MAYSWRILPSEMHAMTLNWENTSKALSLLLSLTAETNFNTFALVFTDIITKRVATVYSPFKSVTLMQ